MNATLSDLRARYTPETRDEVRAWVHRQRSRLTPLLAPYFAEPGVLAELLLHGACLAVANRAHAAEYRASGDATLAAEHDAYADAYDAKLQGIAEQLTGRARRRFVKLTTVPQ